MCVSRLLLYFVAERARYLQETTHRDRVLSQIHFVESWIQAVICPHISVTIRKYLVFVWGYSVALTLESFWTKFWWNVLQSISCLPLTIDTNIKILTVFTELKQRSVRSTVVFRKQLYLAVNIFSVVKHIFPDIRATSAFEWILWVFQITQSISIPLYVYIFLGYYYLFRRWNVLFLNISD